jgi:hypothetical protein
MTYSARLAAWHAAGKRRLSAAPILSKRSAALKLTTQIGRWPLNIHNISPADSPRVLVIDEYRQVISS